MLEEFQGKAANMMNCEGVILTMIDKPTSEIIQFSGNDIVKHKWQYIFNV